MTLYHRSELMSRRMTAPSKQQTERRTISSGFIIEPLNADLHDAIEVGFDVSYSVGFAYC